MSTFRALLPGAWSLTQDIKRELYTLSVPTSWQQVANALAQKQARLRGRRHQAPPVNSLNRIVTASFPKVIRTDNQAWWTPNKPWLLTEERLDDLSLLSILIEDWFREEFTSLGEEEVEQSLNHLQTESWQWDTEPKVISLLQPQNRDEATALFSAIPDFIAQEFLRYPTVSFGQNNIELTFYRVVRPGQAELMSWPPYPVLTTNFRGEAQTEQAYISFVVRFLLHTVPWRQSPIIYHQLSVRRWITRPLEKLPYGGLSPYIGNQLRLVDGRSQSLCFIPLDMKWRNGGPRWPRAIRELLANDTRLPEETSLLQNPTFNWSDFRAGTTQAAISYDNRHDSENIGPIGLAGVGPFDWAYIHQAIQERLSVERVGKAWKVPGTVQPLWPKAASDPNIPMLRPNIAAPAVFQSPQGPLKTVLILWETPQCRDELLAELCQRLALAPKGKTEAYVTHSGAEGASQDYEGEFGSLRICTQHVGDLTQNFEIDREMKIRDRRRQRIPLMETRINTVKSSLPPAAGLCGSIVEIQRKPIPREADPKYALRIGLMQAGYVNQHIHAVTTRAGKRRQDASSRVQQAVSDLLRQCGVLPTNPLIHSNDGVDSHIWLTCFWVLRRTRRTTATNLPNTAVMMVRVNPLEQAVEMTTPSLREKNQHNPWVAYPVGLQHLLGERWAPDDELEEGAFDAKDERLINKFVSDCLRDCLYTPIEKVKQPHVLFMAEAHNARRRGLLTWLQNPNLPANALPRILDIHEPAEKERLWIVRLRLAENGEVPPCIVDPTSHHRAQPGSRARDAVYEWRDVCDGEEQVLYLSIRDSLLTEKYLLKISESRLDHGSKAAGNARPLEIAVVYSPGIDQRDLALLIHALRGRWPYFATDMSLPVPFQFAIKGREYAVGVRDLVESLEFDDKGETS